VTRHASAARGGDATLREDALTRTLLTSGIVSGVGFPGIMSVAGAMREGYSALHQPGSLLSLGPGGWLQIANFVVTGLLMVACAGGFWRALHSGRGATWAPLLVAIYGIGLWIAFVALHTMRDTGQPYRPDPRADQPS
jgi:hypothetical protein